MRKDEQVCDGRQEISDSIAPLQKAEENPSPARRNSFHREGGADSPLSSHPDPEQPAKYQKCGVIRCQARSYFDYGVEDYIDHQGDAPAVPVGKQAEDECADRPECQRHAQGESQLGIAAPEIFREFQSAP